jgi:hypothetical protein
VLLQSRLTTVAGLTANNDVPGAAGVARFVVDIDEGGSNTIVTPWINAQATHEAGPAR